jgi:hypothetical protein
MKPLLHGTGEVPTGIESGFYWDLDDGKAQKNSLQGFGFH